MTSSLASLAILKVNWDRLNRDYVENFVPFVVECARLAHEPVVSIPTVRNDMSVQFGLDLPINTLHLVINRAAKQGYFKRDHHVFYRVDDKCNDTNFRKTRDEVNRIYEGIINDFVSYAADTHDKTITGDEAAESIFAFLREGSLSLLFDRNGHLKRPNNSASFLVASFIQHARDSDQAMFEDIILLARGNLLANAMYLPDPGRVDKRFKRTSIYLDTSFILYAAGFAGPDRAQPCRELLELLSRQGAKLRCFHATRNEIQGVLDAAASRLASGNLRQAYGPTIEYFIEAGKTASDLELITARLPDILRSLGIEVVDTPSFEHKDFQIDERGFEQHLGQSIAYLNPKALVHDVDCISAIARLRAGRDSLQVEECRSLFVTNNVLLARAARSYFQDESTPGAIALAITDYALANLLWLKDPTVAPDLPRHRLVADVYAAMRPSAGLWNAYLAEIAKLEETGKVTPNDYYLLRYSLASKAALMGLTSGQQDAFTQGSVYEILNIVRDSERAELRREFELESKRRDTTERALVDRNKQTDDQLRIASDQVLFVRQRVLKAANIVGLFVRLSAWGLLFPAVLFGIGTSLSWRLTLPQTLAELGLLAGLGTFLLLTLANLLFGTTLRALVDKVEASTVRHATQLVFTMLGLH